MTDSNLQTTDMQQWKKIAEAMNKLEEAQWEAFRALAGDVPKTVWQDQFSQISDAEGKLKSDLEDRMFKEHPDDSDVYTFYPRNDS